MSLTAFNEVVGNAILGIDTLWGGDVMCVSGTGRFIADSWFSDSRCRLRIPIPSGRGCVHPAASAPKPGPGSHDAYLAAVDVRAAIAD